MTAMETLEILKTVATVSAVVLGVYGTWVASHWNVWQKRRELALASTKEFYKSYGEFFAIWKLWDWSIGDLKDIGPEEKRWQLLERSADAEAKMESLYVQLAAERMLTQDDCDDVGKFREIFQSLRVAIKENKKLAWAGSEDATYLAFKALACRVAHLIATSHEKSKQPTRDESWTSLRKITEKKWKDEDLKKGFWIKLPDANVKT